MQVGWAEVAILSKYLVLTAYLPLPVYRVTLIGVFLGHFRINLHQTCTQYSNEEPQYWNAAQFPKITF